MLTPQDLIRDRDTWDVPTKVLASLVESQQRIDVAISRQILEQFGSEIGNLILQSAELQTKARRKFGDGIWWATTRSLQQATTRMVAQIKSDWFPDAPIVDICCGIGGDAMAFSRHREVTLIDQDSVVLAAAVANVTQSDGKLASALCQDARTVSLRNQCWHIDPDRRPTGQRTTQVDEMSPSWDWIASQFEDALAAIIKLAPVTQLVPDQLPRTNPWHRAWISTSAGVCEQSLLIGRCVQTASLPSGTHSSWIVRQDRPVMYFAGLPTQSITSADKIASYIADPDAAVRASGLTATVAKKFNLRGLDGPTGFLTGEDCPTLEFPGTVGRVIWSGSMDDRKLRRVMRQRDVYPSVVKARGIQCDTASIERRYRDLGTRAVTLWLGCAGKTRMAALTEMIDVSGGES
jgi:hypothetical protein